MELPESGRVGVDPHLISAGSWESLCKQLVANGHVLVPVECNLVDEVWEDAPARPALPVFIHPLHLAGTSWSSKVSDVRSKMADKKVVGLVVSMLDEIAWLLNLRGSDISFNPVFFAYVLITPDAIKLFIDDKKVSDELRAHLTSPTMSVTILPYEDITSHLRQLVDMTSTGKIWVSDKTSFSLFDMVPEKHRYNEPTPIALMKSVKNDAEVKGMRNAHIKDAVALCEYFSWLEKELVSGSVQTEVSASKFAETFRQQQDDFVSLSFTTISAVGSNAAIIHYEPSAETDRPITMDQLYLLDSGAQYRDGTTDVTRTVHFGQPTAHEKECFTRVLKGHISLARIIFPNGVKGTLLDSFARQHLWQVGLDYLHGTGHGVGSFLNVHEGPCGIGFRVRPDEVPLQKGMILSNEPGYYEDGNFGIRIENLTLVIDTNTKFNFKDKGFLTFEPLTLVPIQTKLIVKDLLTADELAWLNDYHQKCRDIIGPELQKSGRVTAYDWLLRETTPLA
jgi:Xaa-Pro aminopeptidase